MLIFMGFMISASGVFAQHPATPAGEGDTTITVSKETARKMLEEYSDTEEIQEDLVPDYAQKWMVTDRPHIAESPIMVPKGFVQWESGFQITRTNSADVRNKDLTYNTTLLRLGLSRRVEMRFEMAYEGTKTNKISTDSIIKNSHGFSGLNIAAKTFLFEEKGLRPKGTLLYGLGLPYIGSKEYRPENLGGFIKFLFLNEITPHYGFEYNLGIEWSGDSKQASYVYALNNEFMITQRFNLFAEIYGSFTENNGMDNRFNGTFINDHRANAGFWYLFTKDFQIDFSGGVGLSKASPDFYFAVGLSNRFSVSGKNRK